MSKLSRFSKFLRFAKFFMSTEQRIGYIIGYTAAFIVDTFVKGSAIRYGYRGISWVAKRTKIPTPTEQILFERAVDAVWNAY